MQPVMKIVPFLSMLLLFFVSCDTAKQEPLLAVIDRSLEVVTAQSLLMAQELEDKEGQLPRTLKQDGTIETTDYHWWCCGFFPGTLWYLYENNPVSELKKYAELYTARVEQVKNVTYSHDIGFMLYCSYGNGYRITGNPDYKEVLLTGAHSLAKRYNPNIGLIRSWDFNKDKWQYPVIIDNMMNLELFMWASRKTDSIRFEEMAVSHADKTLSNHFRPDYSCYHVVSYDTLSGLPHVKQTHQGAFDESSWARGQAWALYGYTMMFRETGMQEYLNQARAIAGFLLNHPNMPEDKIPYWDFDAPNIPDALRDASAAAIMASALIELSQLDNSNMSKLYLSAAETQLRTLSSSSYLAQPGSNGYFALMHSVGHLLHNSEVDVPLTYSDYYYTEALLRMKRLLEK